jgi:hypothetical protein
LSEKGNEKASQRFTAYRLEFGAKLNQRKIEPPSRICCKLSAGLKQKSI